MKVKFKFLFFTFLIFIIFYCFIGCASYFHSERELYAGEEITPDQLFEISKGFAESKSLVEDEKNVNSAEEVTEPFVCDTDEIGNILVYWTDNGSVWHINSKCPSFSQSTKINKGTEEVAIAEGKERLCKKCEELIEKENIPKQ